MAKKVKPIVIINGNQCYECSHCKKTKVVNEFHKSRTRHNGIDNYCNSCRLSASYKYVKSIRASKKHNCESCNAGCDGTLVVNLKTLCGKCFDDLIYGENATQWTLPQRSHMLL